MQSRWEARHVLSSLIRQGQAAIDGVRSRSRPQSPPRTRSIHRERSPLRQNNAEKYLQQDLTSTERLPPQAPEIPTVESAVSPNSTEPVQKSQPVDVTIERPERENINLSTSEMATSPPQGVEFAATQATSPAEPLSQQDIESRLDSFSASERGMLIDQIDHILSLADMGIMESVYFWTDWSELVCVI